MRPSRLQHIKLTRTFNLITRMDQAKIPENQFIKVSGVFNTKKGMVAMRDFGSQVWLGIPDPVELPTVELPTVTTSAATSIQETTAILNGELTSLGGADSCDVWFQYRKQGEGTWTTLTKQELLSTGVFSDAVSSLDDDTAYEFRALAENTAGIAEGDVLTFTTEKAISLPTVTTDAITNIEETSAQANGNVTDDGGDTITRRGFIYSTETIVNPGDVDPDTLGLGVKDEAGNFSEGVYSLVLSGLTSGTQYFVRAFAENSEGFSYGNEENFTTLGVQTEVFTESGTFTVPEGVTEVDVLVVAGGGGGGSRQGGGGGAGGLVFEENFSVTPEADITVTVGGGGNGAPSEGTGSDGNDSMFGTITATGGGGGGCNSQNGRAGGSGGGGGKEANGGAGTTGQGHAGGDMPNAWSGAGGGGAGEKGEDGSGDTYDSVAGDGGDGLDYLNTFGAEVGENGWFAGGGGGAGRTDHSNGKVGVGGQGGGGNGGDREAVGDGENATANTGGGGGGAYGSADAGGNGGSGIVIVKYLD